MYIQIVLCLSYEWKTNKWPGFYMAFSTIIISSTMSFTIVYPAPSFLEYHCLSIYTALFLPLQNSNPILHKQKFDDDWEGPICEYKHSGTVDNAIVVYSGDLNSGLVWHSNGPKQFFRWIVHYSSHVLNRELIVWYLNGRKFGNWMAFLTELFTN